MSEAERITGTADEFFNLVSVLYHELQRAETCVKYAHDAEESGDDELADFFRECQAQSRTISDRAKELLSGRLSQSQRIHEHDDELVEESSKQSFPASDAPAY